jgi:hypothetical protein
MEAEADSTELFMREPGSLAPFAVELRRAPASVATGANATATEKSKPASQTGWLVASGAAIAALSLISALGLRVTPAPRAPAEPHAHRVVAAHEAVMVPVLTAPEKDLIVLDEDDATTIPVSALPSRRVATGTPRSMPRGVLRFAPAIKGILIDGAPHRIERGIVVLPCGTHTIKVPSQPTRTLTIACASTPAL